MPSHRAPAADVEIAASAAAEELRFDTAPKLTVRFPGTGKRDSRQVTKRWNVDSPVQPGKTYRRVLASTRISSRLLGPDGSDDPDRRAVAGP
jgi:hypothetical protein